LLKGKVPVAFEVAQRSIVQERTCALLVELTARSLVY